MAEIYHDEHLLDRAVMLAMRGMIALQPPMEFRPEARPGFDALTGSTPAMDGVTTEAAEVGGIAGWWCRPRDAIVGAAVLYLHGGAYVLGSAAAYRNFGGQVATRAKAVTFVPDYALAPERPFPAALVDAHAAYRGLVAAGFTRIALAGDSAGGGLALALLSVATMDAQAGNGPKPVAAAVISPWTDLTLTGESMHTQASADPLLTRDSLASAARLYLGEHDPRDPRASALYATLAGSPPVCLHVGEAEVLLDDSRRFAETLEAAGGTADLHVWQGMVHVFAANLALLRAAPEALDLIGGFLNRNFIAIDQAFPNLPTI